MSTLDAAQVDQVAAAEPVNPGVIWSIIQGHTRYWAVATAVQLGVFAAIADGDHSLTGISAQCQCAAGSLEVLLDALVAVGLLARRGDTYELTAESSAFLVPGGPRYMGDLVVNSPGRQESWLTLADTMRRGLPATPVDDDTGFWRDIAAATWSVQHDLAARTARAAGLTGSNDEFRVLDVGAGAAPWAIALLEALPRATALVNDLPDVIDVARSAVERCGLRERVTFLPADYRTMNPPQAPFDIVVLANIVRTEGITGAPVLLRRAAAWTKPSGLLLLADYFVDDDRRSAVTALLLGLTMAANTRHGATYTLAQYRSWLDSAGFGAVDVLEPAPNQQVLAARLTPLQTATEGGNA